MKVNENPQEARRILHEIDDSMRHVRTGVHVSDLIYCLRKAWYRNAGWTEPPRSDGGLATMLLGHGHHALVESRRDDIETEKPVTIQLDSGLLFKGGIVEGTIDVWYPDLKLVEETKTTRMSSAKDIGTQAQWIEQVASYCLGMGTLTARLVVWHMMGDQSRNREPTLKVWEVTFSPNEMLGWKHELTRRYNILTGEQEPDILEHQTWECRYCPFKGNPCPGGKGVWPTYPFMSDSFPFQLEGMRLDDE